MAVKMLERSSSIFLARKKREGPLYQGRAFCTSTGTPFRIHSGLEVVCIF